MIDEKQRTSDAFIDDALIERLLAEAEAKAGVMKSSGSYYVLLPRTVVPPAAASS